VDHERVINAAAREATADFVIGHALTLDAGQDDDQAACHAFR